MEKRTSLPSSENIQVHRLANGLSIYVYENHTVPAVVVNGSLRAGSVDEPAELAGLAALTATMLRRGTRHHTFAELNERLDALGAAIEISGGRHAMDISANALIEDLPLIIQLIAEMLREPAMNAQEFEKLRHQTITHLKEREHDPQTMAFLTFRRLLYKTHPYGRPVSGWPQTVESITLDHVVSFYRDYVSPDRAQLVIVGDVHATEVMRLVEEALADWKGPTRTQSLPPVYPPEKKQETHVHIPDKSQSDIVIGWLGIPRKHPDWTPLVVTNVLWGRFGMGGRVGERIREKLGLAYYAFGNVDGNFGPGTWNVNAGVAPEHVPLAVENILLEAQRLREERVPTEELEDTKAYIIGSMPVRLETNHGLAAAISDMVWYDLGLDYLVKTEERVRAVHPEDVQRIAQTYLKPDSYTLAVAGPQALP